MNRVGGSKRTLGKRNRIVAVSPAPVAAANPTQAIVIHFSVERRVTPSGRSSEDVGGGGAGCGSVVVVVGSVVVGTEDVGSGPVSVGGGFVLVAVGTVPLTAFLVFAAEPSSFVERIAIPPASAAMTRAARTGQTQSPGYQGTRRRQAVASIGISPCVAGRRRPHSRQYSWNGSYGDPHLGHSPPAASTGEGGGGGCSSGGSGGRATD